MDTALNTQNLREDSDHRLADSILSIILRFANAPDAAFFGGTNLLSKISSRHRNRIIRAIERNTAVRFVLPAFPAKSANHEKTISSHMDLGELLALKRLHATCNKIKAIYSPGAEIIICSDGRIFSDLVSVPDETVSRYGHEIEQAIRKFHFHNLSVFHLDQLLSKQSHQEMRNFLMSKYSQSPDELKGKIKQDPSALRLFNGMHRFIFEDKIALELSQGLKSREKIRKEAKISTYELIRRSDAWSNLVEEYFPDGIRLSIHPQPLESQKLPLRLLPSEDHWRTPWHSSVLFENGAFALVKRKDAESRGAKLFHFEDNYAFFAFSEMTPETFYDFQ